MTIQTVVIDRKAVVKALSEILGCDAKYLGVPSFAYQVGNFTVTKQGTIETEIEEGLQEVLLALRQRGMIETEKSEAEESLNLSIAVPIENHNGNTLRNLENLIFSKQQLISKSVGVPYAFQMDPAFIQKINEDKELETEDFYKLLEECGGNEINIGISFARGKIEFTGFPHNEDFKVTKAYASLAALINKQAIEQKRVRHSETLVENEKYTFRVWLIRLGFGGESFKEERKVLLEKLSGHTAFRTEEEALRAKEKAKAKRELEKQ